MCLQDSPVGVRDTDFNSVFPAGVNVAATWDRGVAYARGQAMGEEHRGKGVDMQLGVRRLLSGCFYSGQHTDICITACCRPSRQDPRRWQELGRFLSRPDPDRSHVRAKH